jgi:hypothetical protein
MDFGQVGRARRPNHGAKGFLELLMSVSQLHTEKVVIRTQFADVRTGRPLISSDAGEDEL